MKLRYGTMRSILRQELVEAEDPKAKEPTPFEKWKADSETWVSDTFFCPRHKLPLEIIWTRRDRSDSSIEQAEKEQKRQATIAKDYKGIQPPTAERPDLVKKTERVSKIVPKWFVCPLFNEPVDPNDRAGATWTGVGSQRRPEAYSKYVREKVADPRTGEESLQRIEKTVRCDYRVTPNFQYPGQKVKHIAVGEVAEELGLAEWQGSGPPRGSTPAPRREKVRTMMSQLPDEESLRAGLEDAGFGALLDELDSMRAGKYRWKKVTQSDAAAALEKFLKAHAIPMVGVAIGKEGDRHHLEVVRLADIANRPRVGRGRSTDVERSRSEAMALRDERLKQLPSKIGGFEVRIVDRPSREAQKWDPTVRVPPERDEIRFARVAMKPSQGKPTFSGDDVFYLSMEYPKMLGAQATAAGKEYAGPKPYRLKANDIQALLFRLGWDVIPESGQERRVTPPMMMPKGEPRPGDPSLSRAIKRDVPSSSLSSYDDEDDLGAGDEELEPELRASISKDEIEDYIRSLDEPEGEDTHVGPLPEPEEDEDSPEKRLADFVKGRDKGKK